MVTHENHAHRTGVVRAIAWSDPWRGLSSPRWARASAKVTSTDQRLTTHARMCAGVAARSGQRNAARRSWPAGSQTSTSRMATGGDPGVHPRAGWETTPSGLRWPPYPSTSPVSQGVADRLAHPCTRRWRFSCMGWGPRWPCGGGPGRWYRAASQRRRETMTTCWVTQASASATAAKPPSTTKTSLRPGSQRRPGGIICRPPSMRLLCRPRWAFSAGQHSVVSKGHAHMRRAQGPGTNRLIDPHFKPKQRITGVLGGAHRLAIAACGRDLPSASAFRGGIGSQDNGRPWRPQSGEE